MRTGSARIESSRGEAAQHGAGNAPPVRRDYERWSIEELRALARQMQLPGAARKTRSELIAIFSPR